MVSHLNPEQTKDSKKGLFEKYKGVVTREFDNPSKNSLVVHLQKTVKVE